MFPGCGVALLPARPVDLRAQGEGVVEYPGKVACPSGRRCSTRNAVWCHSHPGFKSQRYRHCRPAPLGPGGFVMPTWRVRVLGLLCSAGCCLLLVAPLVLRAPEGPAAVCAGGRRPAREPPALRASLGASARCPARPRHRPPAPRQVPPVPSTPAASAWRVVSKPGQAPPRTGAAAWPSGPPMWSGLSCWDFGALRCVLLQTSSIGGVFRVDLCSVVTNVVNLMAFWLKMVVFWLRLTTFVTGVLAGRFKSCSFDDVCNVGRPSVAHPGLATTYGRRSLVLSTRCLGGLKPLSPLRAGEVGQLKPPSPLRVRNGCFWCSFWAQR